MQLSKDCNHFFASREPSPTSANSTILSSGRCPKVVDSGNLMSPTYTNATAPLLAIVDHPSEVSMAIVGNPQVHPRCRHHEVALHEWFQKAHPLAAGPQPCLEANTMEPHKGNTQYCCCDLGRPPLWPPTALKLCRAFLSRVLRRVLRAFLGEVDPKVSSDPLLAESNACFLRLTFKKPSPRNPKPALT